MKSEKRTETAEETNKRLSNIKQKAGETIECPMCKQTFMKHIWNTAFCGRECKNKYWNLHRGTEKRNEMKEEKTKFMKS